MSQFTIHDVTECIYDCIANPEGWRTTLGMAANYLDSSHSFIAARSAELGQPIGFFEYGFDSGYFEKYQQHFYQVDLWTQGLANYRFGEFHASHQVCNDHLFVKSEIYNDFARPANIRHSIGSLTLQPENDLIIELAFMAGRERDFYTKKQIFIIKNTSRDTGRIAL